MRIIKTANAYGDNQFHQYHFHKLLFNVYTELKKKGIDIRLPYSWFYYGSLVEGTTFERMTGSSLGYYAPDHGKLRKIIEIPAYGSDPVTLKTIDAVISGEFSEITEDHHYKKEYGQILLKKTYSNAPFEFQRLFNRGLYPFVEKFKPRDNDQQTLMPLVFDNSDIQTITAYLDQLMVNYPKKALPEIYDCFLEWDDTVRLAITTDHSRIIPLVEAFCKLYCGLLRIKEHENIEPDVIERWKTDFDDATCPEYLGTIDHLRSALLDSHFSASAPQDKTTVVVDKIMILARDLSVEKKTNSV
jgi:hypothetical protein